MHPSQDQTRKSVCIRVKPLSSVCLWGGARWLTMMRPSLAKQGMEHRGVTAGTHTHVKATPSTHDLRAMAEGSRRVRQLYLWSIFPCPLKTAARMELVCHHHKKMTNCFQSEMSSASTDCYAAQGRQEQGQKSKQSAAGTASKGKDSGVIWEEPSSNGPSKRP